MKCWISRRKSDASLHLDVKNRAFPERIVGVYDNVIEWRPFGRLLKFDAFDRCPWQPTRLSSRQHGEQVIGSNLALEVAAIWSA